MGDSNLERGLRGMSWPAALALVSLGAVALGGLPARAEGANDAANTAPAAASSSASPAGPSPSPQGQVALAARNYTQSEIDRSREIAESWYNLMSHSATNFRAGDVALPKGVFQALSANPDELQYAFNGEALTRLMYENPNLVASLDNVLSRNRGVGDPAYIPLTPEWIETVLESDAFDQVPDTDLQFLTDKHYEKLLRVYAAITEVSNDLVNETIRDTTYEFGSDSDRYDVQLYLAEVPHNFGELPFEVLRTHQLDTARLDLSGSVPTFRIPFTFRPDWSHTEFHDVVGYGQSSLPFNMAADVAEICGNLASGTYLEATVDGNVIKSKINEGDNWGPKEEPAAQLASR